VANFLFLSKEYPKRREQGCSRVAKRRDARERRATLSLALRVPSHSGILRASKTRCAQTVARLFRKIPAMLGGG